MKKLLFLFFILIQSILLISCKDKNQIDIVTTSYPAFDIVNNIVKDELNVSMLVKPATEVHGFEPSSKQIIDIKNSKLFVFVSYSIDEWINNNISSLLGENTKSIDMSKHITNNLDDNHFWTNTNNYIELVEYITKELINVFPNNKESFAKNSENYLNKLNELNDEMTTYLNAFEVPIDLYFSGHNALSSFGSIYNLNIVSLSDTNKPDAELTNNQLNELIVELESNDVKFLFTEELADLKIAETIKKAIKDKNNTNLELLELHGYHNISLIDFNNNISYYDLLLRNFNNIKISIGDSK